MPERNCAAEFNTSMDNWAVIQDAKCTNTDPGDIIQQVFRIDPDFTSPAQSVQSFRLNCKIAGAWGYECLLKEICRGRESGDFYRTPPSHNTRNWKKVI